MNIEEENVTVDESTSDYFLTKVKGCPVQVGDRFYRKTNSFHTPDRLEVLEIKKVQIGYVIRAKYIYHTIGPVFERSFSDIIFKDPNWVIEKKGVDF